MSFILDVPTENAPEFKTLPDGSEVEIRIVSAEMKNSKAGAPMLALRLDVPAEPYVNDINHFIMLPTNSDDEKTAGRKLNRLKDFKAAFRLPAAGSIASEDMEGATAWAILGEEDSPDFGKQNRVKRFLAGA